MSFTSTPSAGERPSLPGRRAILRGLVSLPLIGGGVTLIGAPSRPVPLVRAVALPDLGDPRQRARYAWEAFSAAMRDLTAGTDGWTIGGGERHRSVPGSPAGPWIEAAAIRIGEHRHPSKAAPFYSEHHDRIAL